MSLADKIKQYEETYFNLQALEEEIKEEVAQLGQSQQVGRVTASWFPNGRGKYDWESIAKSLEPDDEIIDANTETKVTVKWKKIAEQLEATDELKNRFYTPGNPFVSISVK